MATTKSVNITLLDASPKSVASNLVNGAYEHVIKDTIETGAIVAVDDIIIMARVPVGACITSIQFSFDDMGTTGDFDIGFYQGTQSDGTAGIVLDRNAIASALDVNAAALVMTDYRFTLLDEATVQQPAWDLATLSASPSYDYIDIAITPTEATTQIGTISCIIKYTEAVN